MFDPEIYGVSITILAFEAIRGFVLAQLIRPGSVKVLSQDGEVRVTIDLQLTINLNGDGLTVGATATAANGNLESLAEKMVKADKIAWEIPDFGPVPKVDFGKKE